MTLNYSELTRQVFVLATALLEDAHEVAVAGQLPQIAATVEHQAERLKQMSEELGIITEFLTLLVRLERQNEDNKRDWRRS